MFDPIQSAIDLMILSAVKASVKASEDRAAVEEAAEKASAKASVKVPVSAPTPITIVSFEAANQFILGLRIAARQADQVAFEEVVIRELTGNYFAPHGTCLDAARSLAMVAIRRHKGAWGEAPRTIKPTIVGYAAGKWELDRLARIRRDERIEWRTPFQENEEQVALLLRGESRI